MGFGASKLDPDLPTITPILVPRTLKGYPSPKPPSSRKKHIYKHEIFTGIDERSRNVTICDDTSYQRLLATLTKGMFSDVEKVRAIFAWLGCQRVYDDSYPGVCDPTTPRGYMKLIKKQLGSYTEFFTLLCRAANIPCVIVRGRCKGSNYEVGDYISPCMTSTWTAVYVDEDWRIIHPFWAFAGVNQHTYCEEILLGTCDYSVSNTSSTPVRQQYNDFFFLTDPDDFRYFCWPEKSEWQLIEKPWSFEDFSSAPYFYQQYFTSGLTLKSEYRSVLRSKSGVCTIRFGHRSCTEAQVTSILFLKQNSSGKMLSDECLDSYVCKEANHDQINLHVRFPTAGVFKIVVYGGPSHSLEPLVDFRLECQDPDMCDRPFPINPSIGCGFGLRALGSGLIPISHTSGIVPILCEMEVFEFDHPRPGDVEAVLFHHSLHKSTLTPCVRKSIHKHRVHFVVSLPDAGDAEHEEYGLQIYIRASSRRLVNVMNYLLTNQQINFNNDTKSLEKIGMKFEENNNAEMYNIILDDDGPTKDRYNIFAVESQDIGLNNSRHVWTTDEFYLKGNISNAMRVKNRKELEKSLYTLECHGHDMRAMREEKEFLAQLYEKEIKMRREANDIEGLTRVIAETNQSVAIYNLEESKVLEDSKIFIGRQIRVKQYSAVIQTLTKQTVSEIARLQCPAAVTHDVMIAIFVLLGEDEKLIQKWSDIQYLLRLTGHYNIVNRIGRFSLDMPRAKSVRKVKHLLTKYTMEEVKESSYGVTAFYLWSLGVLREIS